MPTTGADTGVRLPVRTVAIALFTGLVVGGLIGAVAGSGRSRTYTATTVVQLQPDDAVTDAQGGGTADPNAASNFVQGELVVLGSTDVRAAVQRQLGLPSLPAVSATEAGSTYVVDVTASGRTSDEARRVADAARTVYATRRTAALTQELQAAQTAVRAQLAQVTNAIAATPGATTDGSGGLQQEYQRLLVVSSRLQLASGQLGRAVTTIEPATAEGGGLSPTGSWGAGGAVVGLLVAFVGLAALRGRPRRVREPDDLADLGVPVLRPALPRAGAGRVRAGRLVAAQLVDPATAAGGIVLVGLDDRHLPGDLVRPLTDALAEEVCVVVVSADGADPDLPAMRAAELMHDTLTTADLGRLLRLGRRTQVLADDREVAELADHGLFETARHRRCAVVVVAPPLAESTVAIGLARRVGAAAVVVSTARSRPADVADAVDVLRARGVGSVHAVVVARPRRHRAVPVAETRIRPVPERSEGGAVPSRGAHVRPPQGAVGQRT